MLIDLTTRSSDEEIMDDLDLDEPVLFRTLEELDFINSTLGGNSISLKAFSHLCKGANEISVMDLGSGSGMILQHMYNVAQKSSVSFKGWGVDANPHITRFAADKHGLSQIAFKDWNVFDESCYEVDVDIIHACLFTHHFSDDQLIWFFKKWKQTARKAVIINDLHRHRLAYYSIKWLTALFSSSSMVRYDAPLSVARGFTKDELKLLLQRAGIIEYQLQWKWAFRWLLVF